MNAPHFTIDEALCIRCASCSVLAPAIFRVDTHGSHVIRQPASADERAECEAARINCPAAAIVDVRDAR